MLVAPEVENLRYHQEEHSVWVAYELQTPNEERYRFASLTMQVHFFSDGELVETFPDMGQLGRPGDRLTFWEQNLIPYRGYEVDDVQVEVEIDTAFFNRESEKEQFTYLPIEASSVVEDDDGYDTISFSPRNDTDTPIELWDITFSCVNADGDFVLSHLILGEQAIPPHGTVEQSVTLPSQTTPTQCEGTLQLDHVSRHPFPTP